VRRGRGRSQFRLGSADASAVAALVSGGEVADVVAAAEHAGEQMIGNPPCSEPASWERGRSFGEGCEASALGAEDREDPWPGRPVGSVCASGSVAHSSVERASGKSRVRTASVCRPAAFATPGGPQRSAPAPRSRAHNADPVSDHPGLISEHFPQRYFCLRVLLDVLCVTGRRHDLRSQVMQFPSLTASLPTNPVERLVRTDRLSSGDNPFCLLDHDSRIQCGL
jgi:hypothetical protein